MNNARQLALLILRDIDRSSAYPDRALEAAGGVEHSRRALAGLARREGARSTSGGARGNLRTVK